MFNCSINDLDYNLANISLYGNFTGVFSLNETISVSGDSSSILFNKSLDEGFYQWNCFIKDNLSLASFYQENFSFTVDYTPPNISSIFVNESYVCGDTTVRVSCNVNDNLSGINRVIIEAKKPSGYQNYSAQLLFGNTYYSDVLINEDGEWFFNCITNDSSGNYANLSSEAISSNLIDLFVNFSEIYLNNYNPIEFQEVSINTNIYNLGYCNASNFLVGFYKGDPLLGLQLGENLTTSINGLSNVTVNITWNAEIGPNNIFVFADPNNSISEYDESNNIANKTFNVNAWQIFYGNVSTDKILSDNLLKNMSTWLNESYITGNIFITDKEANIDWWNLTAISRNKNGDFIDNDFIDIDSLLNMTNFNDSVSNIFSNNGIPKFTDNFLVHQKVIQNVPVVNSTNNSNFFTGILWDSSDDKDGEFSVQDKEDLVFIAKVNQGKLGAYGNCDYEANIPVRLRDYKGNDFTEIYFYYELN